MQFDLSIVSKHFPELPSTQIQQLENYANLIAEWNAKIKPVVGSGQATVRLSSISFPTETKGDNHHEV